MQINSKKIKGQIYNSYRIFKQIKLKNKKRSAFNLSILSFFSYFLELVSLGAIIPLIFLILQKDKMMSYVGSIEILSSFSYDKVITLSILSILFFSSLKFIVLIYFNYYTNFFFSKVQTSASAMLLDKYLKNSYNFFLIKNISALIANVKIEAERLRGFYGVLINLIFELTVVISILFFILYINIIGSLVFIIFIILSSYIFLTIIRKYSHRISERKSYFYKLVNNHLFRIFKNIKFIKIFRMYDYALFDFLDKDKKDVHQVAKFLTISVIPKIYFEYIFIISTLILLSLLFFILAKEDVSLIAQYLSLYALMAFRVLPSISRVYTFTQQLNFYGNSVSIFNKDYFDNKFKENNSKFLIRKLNNNVICKFSNVDFSYKKNVDKKILSNTSFEINKNDKIAVVGPSGVGKSTVIDLILGILKADKGTVNINEKFSNNLNILKNKIGYVSQNVQLIDGSVKDNIIFGSDISNISRKEVYQKLYKCAKITNSLIFINKLKNKFNTRIYEDGKNLSAGQRQRILIARSIFNQPRLLLMDEPTSALDNKNSTQIIKNIIKLNKNMTVVIVTHHKNILNNFNKTLILKNGKIRVSRI